MFILPIRKNSPVRHDSWVIYALIIANFSVFVATSILSSGEGVARRYGFIPAQHDLITVLTSMFLHADMLHILGNMFFLWMFGESIEEAVGHVVMAVCYVACGIVAIAFFYVINPHSKVPCIGASGAISGMMGMYLVLFPRARMDLKVYVLHFHVRTFSTSSVGAVGAWIGEQILLGVFGSATRVSFGVAFWAHVGGVLAGLGLGLALTRSGFPSNYTRLVARKASRFMICPSCGDRVPRMPAGNYACQRCEAKLHVDEAGNVGLGEPSATRPPAWIVLTIVVVALGWVARMFYNFWQH